MGIIVFLFLFVSECSCAVLPDLLLYDHTELFFLQLQPHLNQISPDEHITLNKIITGPEYALNQRVTASDIALQKSFCVEDSLKILTRIANGEFSFQGCVTDNQKRSFSILTRYRRQSQAINNLIAPLKSDLRSLFGDEN